jgi:small subunit ribosomal protein S1
VGEVVPGIVTKLATFGAFARIEGPVEGLIHVSELVDRRIAHSQEAVREGDVLPLKIIRIERDRHRLGLSLKQARDQGERMGFTFSPDGEVLSVPEEIQVQFGDEVAALRSSSEAATARAVTETDAGAPAEREIPTTPDAETAENEDKAEVKPPEPVEEELPQTQMAAAFAAINMDQLASDTPPEETKA